MTWVDLTQPFHADMPHSSGRPSPTVETLSDVGTDGVNVQWYGAPTHVGTHVDAPRHFVPGGDTIDEMSVAQFTGPGVVLNLARDQPREISLASIEAAAEAAGGVQAGDIVLVRTGWGEHFDDHETYRRYPWLAAPVADWLVEREISLLAVDSISPDRPRAMRPDDWDDYPLHRTLLPAGIPIAEHLYLEKVAGERLEIFGFPLKLRDGDGAPARFVGRIR